jgi:hypothetical protein
MVFRVECFIGYKSECTVKSKALNVTSKHLDTYKSYLKISL